jgi:exopolysaccharide biosynthesis polyprenyl glycosylphosphotransferase
MLEAMLKNRRYIRVVVNRMGNFDGKWARWAVDALLMGASFALALALRFGDLDTQNPVYFDFYVQMGVVQALVWGLLSQSRGLLLYQWEPGWGWKDASLPFLRILGLHIAVTALLLVALKFTLFSRWFWALHFLLFTVLAAGWRAFALQRLRRRWSDPKWARSIWLVGDGHAAQRFAATAAARPDWGLRLDRHVVASVAFQDGCPVLPLDDKPYALYCALPGGHPDVPRWLRWAENEGIRFRYLPDLGEWGSRRAVLHTESGFPTVQLRPEPLAQPLARLAKRVLDVVVSTVVLVLIGWWLIPLAAVALQIESRGPVFFRQVRHGYGGQTFVLWKLRTMRPHADEHTKEAAPDDPRITRVGQWMRRLAIDEFPQFAQVWWGTLSLVGPRPHMVAQTPEFQRRVAHYALRHWVKPGLTGLAQVRGYRGDSSDQILLDKRIEADLYYVENASLLLDLQILFETGWWWITGRGGAQRPGRTRR